MYSIQQRLKGGVMILQKFFSILTILLLIGAITVFLFVTEAVSLPESIFTERSSTEMSSNLTGELVDDYVSEEISHNLLEEDSAFGSEDKLLDEDEIPYEEEPEVFSFENGRRGLRALRAQLENHIAGLGGNYSIYVKNLDTNEYLMINNREQTPASLIKLFNFAYGIIRIENGTLESTPQLETWLTNSIVISCNDSYNHVLVALGSGNLLDGARQTTDLFYSLGFNETVVGGTLHPSHFPSLHFSNSFTSVRDVGHILEKIYRGTLGNETASRMMLEILLEQQRLGKIPAGLPPYTIVASKTGEFAQHEHDSAIVFSENANYVIVIMTENAPSAIRNIQDISRMVYEHFNPTGN